MSAAAMRSAGRPRFRLNLAKNHGLLAIIVVFACLLLFVDVISPSPLAYYDFASLTGSGAVLALA